MRAYVKSSSAHASVALVSGPFGPYQEIIAGVAFLVARLQRAVSAFVAVLKGNENGNRLMLRN
jgi:hypothetical protein